MNIHNMSISRKVMLTLTAVLIAFLVLQYLFLYKIILRDFESLQADIAIKDAKRCQDEIESELAHLKTLAIDWSAWDDTYNYIDNDDKKKYEKANLPGEIFTAGTFDLLYIFDKRGKVVFNKIYDPTKKNFIKLNLFDTNCFSIDHWLLQHDSLSSSITGLIETEAGIMMLSSNPIVTSEFKGPINGTLVI